jgi:hypothetical protein
MNVIFLILRFDFKIPKVIIVLQLIEIIIKTMNKINDFEKEKILTGKDFVLFQKFMLSETTKNKNKRELIYKEAGGLNAKIKAKFIIDKIGPYIYGLVSKLEDGETPSNFHILEEVQKCLSGVKLMLKAKEQENAFNEEFKTLNIQEGFEILEQKLRSHKTDIYAFTVHMFSSIIKNLNENNTPDISDFKDLMLSEEIYNYVVKAEDSISDEDYNLGKILLRALSSEKKSVNSEIIGRVYGYIKSGWCEADLCGIIDSKTNPTLTEFANLIQKIKNNPHSFKSSDVEKNNEKLSALFTARLNQIGVALSYDRAKQQCNARQLELHPTKVAGSSQADIALPYFNNPSKYLSIYCTGNENLYYTSQGKEAWSVLSHQKINSKYLFGKTISQLDVGKTGGLQSIMDKTIYEATILDMDVINISPAIMGNKAVESSLKKIFNKPTLNQRQKSLINTFPFVNIILNYKPDDDSGITCTIDDICRIKENISLNDRYQPNIWEAFINQVEISKVQGKQLEKMFVNKFLIPYLDEIIEILKNNELKSDFIINSNENTNVGYAAAFIKNLPSVYIQTLNKIIDNPLIINAENKKTLEKIGDFIITNPTFSSNESKQTIGNEMKLLGYQQKELKEKFEILENMTVETTQELIKTLKTVKINKRVN